MREKKRRGHGALVIVLLLVILALAAIACLLALRLYGRADTGLAGSWRMQADLSETARSRANAWLKQAALGEQVDAADYLPRLHVDVRLTLSEDGRWTRRLEAADYEAALTQAQQGLAKALTELMRLRIAAAGRPPETAGQAEARIVNAIGMSPAEYMRDHGPALLPALEELRAFYDGSGTWQADGRHLRFIVDDGLLVLLHTGGTEVYERAK